ncbi:MAG: hypothetical protein V4721_15580 [Bacteroidota bacterium]
MKIQVTDPVTNTDIEMDAQQQEYNGEDAWKLDSVEHGSFILLENNGDWKAAGDRNLVPEFVREIGLVLSPMARFNSSS